MWLLLRLGFPMLAVVALLLLLISSNSCSGFIFNLERAFPLKHINVTHHVIRDQARHGRLLHGAIDFPVGGDGIYQTGLYYSKVSLGTPPKDFYVQIDTGSELLWVSCNSCKGCPTKSPVEDISLDFYDPIKSSTSSLVSCLDQRCELGFDYSTRCSTDNRCLYSIKYYDESVSSGFYVSDLLHYSTRDTSSHSSNHSATPVVFGCSNVQKGNLAEPVQIVDGIFGFGRHGLSVIAQLSVHEKSPKSFSHCLRGDADGGGVLVLGEIVEPGMVFSPLIRKKSLYSLKLLRISVNDKMLPVDHNVFSNSLNLEALIDTGTTFAYLPDEVHQHFISAIIGFIKDVTFMASHCYTISSRVTDVFPSVRLIFEGEAILMLNPKDYLLPISPSDGIWCMGFKSGPDTILGDLVLKNKIVVYDLLNQRIGWKNYDCSKTVNVSTTIRDLHSDAHPRALLSFTSWITAFITFFFVS